MAPILSIMHKVVFTAKSLHQVAFATLMVMYIIHEIRRELRKPERDKAASPSAWAPQSSNGSHTARKRRVGATRR